MYILADNISPFAATYSAVVTAGTLGLCLAKAGLALTSAAPESLFVFNNHITTNISDRSSNIRVKLAKSHLFKMFFFGVFLFALHLFHFPVTDGISGHILGGVLSAVVLGPFSAALVMASVIIVQMITLNYGHLSAMGMNLFNMALVGTLVSYWIYYFIHRNFRSQAGFYAGVVIASSASRLLVAIAYSLELKLMDNTSFFVTLGSIMPAYCRLMITAPIFTLTCIHIVRSFHWELEGKVIE